VSFDTNALELFRPPLPTNLNFAEYPFYALRCIKR
jgi:hypothetical protein